MLLESILWISTIPGTWNYYLIHLMRDLLVNTLINPILDSLHLSSCTTENVNKECVIQLSCSCDKISWLKLIMEIKFLFTVVHYSSSRLQPITAGKLGYRSWWKLMVLYWHLGMTEWWMLVAVSLSFLYLALWFVCIFLLQWTYLENPSQTSHTVCLWVESRSFQVND